MKPIVVVGLHQGLIQIERNGDLAIREHVPGMMQQARVGLPTQEPRAEGCKKDERDFALVQKVQFQKLVLFHARPKERAPRDDRAGGGALEQMHDDVGLVLPSRHLQERDRFAFRFADRLCPRPLERLLASLLGRERVAEHVLVGAARVEQGGDGDDRARRLFERAFELLAEKRVVVRESRGEIVLGLDAACAWCGL